MIRNFDEQPIHDDRRIRRFAAGSIGGGALLALLMVLHHPTLDRSSIHDAAQTADAIARLASADRFVHGMLMLLYGLQTVGFFYLSQSLRFGRPIVLTGFVAFAAGTFLTMIPATLDGFVTPDLPALCRPTCAGTDLPGIAVISIAIQDFTRIGLVAFAISSLSWGVALLSAAGWLSRLVGLIGSAAGAVSIGLIVVVGIVLTPATLALIVLSQLVWNLAAAAWLVAGAPRGS